MARQKLGQHFLKSTGILEKIAVAACGERTGFAVEIGPGRGALTGHLLAHADRVIAIELDEELVRHLRESHDADPRLEIWHSDALRTDYSAFGEGVLAGNLPYYAATAIIGRYLRKPGALKHGVFLIQKEVADRICAQPRTRDYGYLSVESQLLAEVSYLFTVPPGAFQPPPKVDSAVIRVVPRLRGDGLDVEAFLRFASACFRQKRKMLRNNLAVLYSKEVLSAAPRMSQRAEELSPDELIDLYRFLAA